MCLNPQDTNVWNHFFSKPVPELFEESICLKCLDSNNFT